MITDTPLTRWLETQMKRRRLSGRALSLMASEGRNHNVVAAIEAKGTATWQECRRLARALDVPATEVLVLAGHLDPEEIRGERLSDEEREVVQELRRIKQRERREVAIAAMLGVLRGLQETTGASDQSREGDRP